MPIAVALLAGVLATLNPCGFALLPAYLALYVGANDNDLPHAPTCVLGAILAGLTATAGLLLVFAVVGVPVALGAGQLADTIPWVGFAVGVAMALVAIATLAGRSRLPFPPVGCGSPGGDRRASCCTGWAMAWRRLVAPYRSSWSPSARRWPATGRWPRSGSSAPTRWDGPVDWGWAAPRRPRTRPRTGDPAHLRWINGGLLLLVSAYLVDYWGSVLFASADGRAGDLLVGSVQRSNTRVQTWVTVLGGRWLLAGVAAIVALWQWTLRPGDAADGDRGVVEPVPSRTDASTIAGH